MTTKTHLEGLSSALDSGAIHQVRRLLNSLSTSEIAHVLESSPPNERNVLWELVDTDSESDVLQRLSEDVRNYILELMDSSEVAALTETWDVDDVADILQQLPDRVTQEVLDLMSHQDRQRVETVLTYDEESAGGLMNTDTITVRADITIDVVLRYLRRHDEIPAMTSSIYVVNRDDLFIGALPIRSILTADPSVPIYKLMDSEAVAIPADMTDTEVANLFERNDWISAPVVDENRHLIGRITIDDVVDVIREDADHSLLGLAGLAEDDDTFLSLRKSTPRRMLWLGINLITALVASVVIGQFQATLDKVIALAVLMPIVASMGGVAGTQTLTVVIRGMALGHIQRNNMKWLLNRELILGAVNGMFWAVTVGLIAGLWFQDFSLSLIIAAAMTINLIAAAAAGVLLPVLLKRMHIDPALAGGVALTTVTDVVGFLSFLGFATLVYA
ncbi:MAG: magnesium transporter [Porticoccaceae bacterium]|nr:magnesium transporter [Porticoccaceae bacterium]